MNPDTTKRKTQTTRKRAHWLFAICVSALALTANACSEQHAQPISTPSAEHASDAPATEVATADHANAIPAAYADNCAKCHGAAGEGRKSGKDKGPLLTDVTTRDEDPLTPGDLAMIIDDAEAQGLNSKMPPFKDKLTPEQKRAIVDWIVASAPQNGQADRPTIAAK